MGSTGDAGVRQLDVELSAGAGRSVPVRMFFPENGCESCALVIFSHGAFSTYDRYDRLLVAWAEAGLVVAALLHVDSEAHPERDSYGQNAALPTRVEDYLAARDSLPGSELLQAAGITLSGQLVAAGHSFGALIAQIAGGANPPTLNIDVSAVLERERPDAVVAISPPPPITGYIEPEHWAKVVAPMLVVTGTRDVIPDFVTDWRQHLVSFEAAPDESAYALIFDDADHYFNGAFGRPTPDGERMAPVIRRLNQSIVGFIDAVRDGVSPAQTAWWRALPASVRSLAHGAAIIHPDVLER